MSDTIKGVKIKALPEKDTMTDTDILVIEDSEATKQISAEAMKTYFTADLAEQIEKLKDENAELSDELQNLEEKNTELSNEVQKLENENTELSSELYKSVEFYNGDEWLETVVVMRGDDAVYTGDAPQSPDGDGYVFSGWSPEPVTIKENVKCYAQYIAVFAIYSETDNSLIFYCDDVLSTEGNIYNNKIITKIYTGFHNKYYDRLATPWNSECENIVTVNIDESVEKIEIICPDYWFTNFSNCTAIEGLGYLHVNISSSATTTATGMFQNCTKLKTLDVSEFDTHSINEMSYMFDGCTALTTIYSDDSVFVTDQVATSIYMFRNCTKLVGGTGYAFNSNFIDVSMANTNNYFTAK